MIVHMMVSIEVMVGRVLGRTKNIFRVLITDADPETQYTKNYKVIDQQPREIV